MASGAAVGDADRARAAQAVAARAAALRTAAVVLVGGGHVVDNTEPKPFVWTATADSILAKVRRGRVTLDAITNYQ